MNAADERRRFAELVLPHIDAAYNLARWLSGSAVEAEDVVQEALLRAYTYFASYHGDRPRPWLLAIVRNTWFAAWSRDRPSRDAASYEDGIDASRPCRAGRMPTSASLCAACCGRRTFASYMKRWRACPPRCAR